MVISMHNYVREPFAQSYSVENLRKIPFITLNGLIEESYFGDANVSLRFS